MQQRKTKHAIISCELCSIDGIEDYELKYFKREMGLKEVISQLQSHGYKVYSTNWYNHLRYHVKPEYHAIIAQNGAVLANEFIDKTEECITAIETIQSEIDSLKPELATKDPSIIKAWTGLLAESRHWLEVLAKLQGEFKNIAKIQVDNIHVEYNNVVDTVIQEACPACKLKFADKLSQKVIKNITPINDNTPSS